MKFMKEKKQSGWAQALLFCTLLAAGSRQVHADEFDDLRQRWLQVQPGISNINLADQDIAGYRDRLVAQANRMWTTMDKSPNRTALWPEWSDWSKSPPRTGSYFNLKTMAMAYTLPGSSLQNNAELASDIISAIDWMYANAYNESFQEVDNWWDWQIGSPMNLSSVVLMMAPQLTPVQIANYQRVLDRFCPSASDRLKRDGTLLLNYETGANLLDKALIQALRGVLAKNADKLAAARDATSKVFPYVTKGDGFYRDGSFIQHNNVAYTGSYGVVLVADLAKLFYLLKDSPWAITDPASANVFSWVDNTFRPVIYDGAMMGTVQGRGQASEMTQEHTSGRAATLALLNLAQGAPADIAAKINGYLKGWITRDTVNNYYGPAFASDLGVSPRDITLIKQLLADTTVIPEPEMVRTRVYAAMERAQLRHQDFAFNVTMSSKRIAAFEWSSTQNLQPWWSGMGMTALYNGDQDQFDKGYFATVNRFRLPGTTTDGSGSSRPVGTASAKMGMFSWSGGATLSDQFASSGMQFGTLPTTGTSLQGKKSWFLLGNKVVAMGSGITATDGREVETIVENRRLSDTGTNTLTVNGIEQDHDLNWSDRMPDTQWAHLAGTSNRADIGYFFPQPTELRGIRETRTGSWSETDTSGTTTSMSHNYLTLAINHNVSPTNAGYIYAVLPNRSPSEMALYAANPDFKVLANSTNVHAIQDASNKVVGANFWIDNAEPVVINNQPYLSSDKQAAIVTRNRIDGLEVAIADPTVSNRTINVEIHRSATEVQNKSSGITVNRLSPTIKLSVNTNTLAGQSQEIKFTLAKSLTLGAMADSFVRDGTSYADTVNGNSSYLTVKNDVPGYTRQAYLKFNLANVKGDIASAKLVIASLPVNGRQAMMHNAYLVPDNTWSESTLTWNNRPAINALLGSWAVTAAGGPVEVDVTAAVNNALNGDKLLSMRIEAASNYGSAGQADYRSKESTVQTNKPQLVITYQ